jgi:hypothetical protein
MKGAFGKTKAPFRLFGMGDAKCNKGNGDRSRPAVYASN